MFPSDHCVIVIFCLVGDSIDYCDVVASLGAETTQLTDGYAYILTKTPVIYSVNPTSGLSNGGSSLTITGTGFRY